MGPRFHKIVKNVKILELRDFIRNQHEKLIQMSTNMPSIGLVICEIGFEIQELCEGKELSHMVQPIAACSALIVHTGYKNSFSLLFVLTGKGLLRP